MRILTGLLLLLLVLLSLSLMGCSYLGGWEGLTSIPPAEDVAGQDREGCPEPPPCPDCDCPACPEPQEQGGSLLTPSPKEEYLVELINDYRQERGLSPLEWDSRLYIAAVLHAQAWTQACRTREGCSDQCWKNSRCPYELPFSDRLKLAGYEGSAQELLAAGDGYYDSRDVLHDWTDQTWYPGAYAALNNPGYTKIACSFVRCHKCWVHTIYVCLLGLGAGEG